MSSNCVSPVEFNAKNLSVTAPRKKKNEKTKSEKIMALMLYNEAPAYWETTACRAPFGVAAFAKGETNTNDYSLNLSLDPEHNFTKQLAKVDDMMIDYGIKHSKLIFGTQYTPDQRQVVQALYKGILKPGKVDGDNVYPPRISPKIKKSQDDQSRPNILFYHSRGEEVEVESFRQLEELIPKGTMVKALIVPRPWFISGRFGVSLDVIQVLAPKRQTMRPKTYAFNDDQEFASQAAAAAAADDAKASEQETNAESEEEQVEEQSVENTEEDEAVEAEDASASEAEEEEEEEDEEEPAPPSPPKKTKKPSVKASTAKRSASKK